MIVTPSLLSVGARAVTKGITSLTGIPTPMRIVATRSFLTIIQQYEKGVCLSFGMLYESPRILINKENSRVPKTLVFVSTFLSITKLSR